MMCRVIPQRGNNLTLPYMKVTLCKSIRVFSVVIGIHVSSMCVCAPFSQISSGMIIYNKDLVHVDLWIVAHTNSQCYIEKRDGN